MNNGHWQSDRVLNLGLTFDDVLLVPRRSEVHPKDLEVSSFLTREISLNVPLVSAAMDTVTESELAIALAREGGIGMVHKNLTPQAQAGEVDKVKRSESGMIMNPITVGPSVPLREALDLMAKYKISGVPITEPNGTLVGILTNRDVRFAEDLNIPVSDLMTSKNLVTVPVGTTLEEARTILSKNRIEKLPVVDGSGHLKGLITVKDISKKLKYPHACKDKHGRLRVGAAVGVSDDGMDRVDALVEAHVDVITLDSAHGHSKGVLEALAAIRKRHPKLQLVGGNVATGAGTKDLIEVGVNAVKVGMGPGASCTTRIVAGIGIPQVSAIMECVAVAEKSNIPVIADGGIKYSGDIVKALASGASSVMIGNLFAGTSESPGESILLEGRSYKVFRGMGSVGAMREGSGDRYFQGGVVDERKLVSEGIEGRVPYKGRLRDLVFQLVGGLRSGMGYCGATTIDALRTEPKFIRITPAGMRESHPHDVAITKEAPNYEVR